MKLSNSVLDTIYLDVMELIYDLRFSFHNSPHSTRNPTAFERVREQGDWVMCCCPVHPENNPSFGILRTSPYHANCFVCGYLGTIDRLVERVFDLPEGEGIKFLLSKFVVEEKRQEIDIESIIDSGRKKFVPPTLPESVLDTFRKQKERDKLSYEILMGYMRKRGFTDRTLNVYEIMADTVDGSIVFPQRDRKGRLRFIQKRRLKGNPRFLNIGDASKVDILFGLHFIEKFKTTPRRIRRVRIVESPTDVLACYQCGIAAVALNGRVLFNQQIKELKLAGVEIVDLMLDNDEEGRQGTREAAEKLDRAGFIVNIVQYPDGTECKDANDLLLAGQLDKCKVVNYNLLGGLQSE